MTDLVFVTLGPAGSCHQHAVRRYLAFQGLAARIEFVDNLVNGIDMIRGRDGAYLVQCSAHPDVHVITERYVGEVFVVDTFLHPTRELGVVVRRDVAKPTSLGIVPACTGYVDLADWADVHYFSTKPVVGDRLLAGEFDAGVTYAIYAEQHPDVLRLEEFIGEVDTTWLVYGNQRRYTGEVVGTRCPEFFTRALPT